MYINRGTLHLVFCGKRRVVVCSDSRGHSDEAGPSPEIFTKLFGAGKRTLCGMSGVLTLPPDVYVSSGVARLCSGSEFRDSPRDLLRAIRDDMREPLTAAFSENPLPDLPTIFSAFSVRRQRSGEVAFWDLDFPIKKTPNGDRSLGEPTLISRIEGIPTGPFYYHVGRGDCLPGDLIKRVHPDSPEADILRGVDDIFDLAMTLNKSCRDEIGGPIDVAVIDSVGVSWLRRNPIPRGAGFE